MTRTRSALIALAAVGGALPLSAAFPAAPAGASWSGENEGIEYVAFTPQPEWCGPEYPILCLDGMLPAASNTLLVTQTEQDGVVEATSLIGTGPGGALWLSTHLSAQCKANWRLFTAAAMLGTNATNGTSVVMDEPLPWQQDIPVNSDNRTIPGRNIEVMVPIGEALPYARFRQSTQEVLDAVEHQVDLAVAMGVPEEEVRAEGFFLIDQVSVVGLVGCQRVAGNKIVFAGQPVPMDIRIHVLPIAPTATVELPEPTPGKDQQAGDGLVAATQVTQAHLSVIEDPQDPCTLHLSAAFTTTAPTTLQYRFLDTTGRRSATYALGVDQTLGAFASHEVAIPSADGPGDPSGGLTAPTTAGIGGFTEAPTDLVQGTYRIEVLAPHHLLGPVAGFSVPPCPPAPPAAPTGSLVTPTTVTPPTTVAPPAAPTGLIAPTTSTTVPPVPPTRPVGELATPSTTTAPPTSAPVVVVGRPATGTLTAPRR